ncbi:solute carrier family 43 member 3a isoform X3 [Mastacembelus armatus]|uniref:solute carrier family 43 member 3a isoform X3 n=1 Tax=Mastacembelus armatus TaxID=205130 RepID=UPI000E45BA78|nr:uncharacterized protein LOC113128159 isoform X3 [Mastacembelus armatus]
MLKHIQDYDTGHNKTQGKLGKRHNMLHSGQSPARSDAAMNWREGVKHAALRGRYQAALLADSGLRDAGVPVLFWCGVWLRLSGVCAKGGWILQSAVCHCPRYQQHPEQYRLQQTGRAVLSGLHHHLVCLQRLEPSQWLYIRSVRHHGDQADGNIFVHYWNPSRGLFQCRWATCLPLTAPPSSPSTMVPLTPPQLCFSSSSIIHLVRTFLLMPKSHIPYHLPEYYTYGLNCGKGNANCAKQSERTGGTAVTVSLEPTGGDKTSPAPEQGSEAQDSGEVVSFWSCVLSRFFMWHLLWFSIMQLRHFLFIGTLNSMLSRLANRDSNLVSQYTNAFAVSQLCGVLCAPWNGLIMDRHKGKPLAAGETEQEADLHSSYLSLFLTSLQCLLFSMCASIPLLPLQYLTFILQFSSLSLWEVVWPDDVDVCCHLSASVPLLHPDQWSSGWRSLGSGHCSDSRHSAGVYPSYRHLHLLQEISSPQGKLHQD